MKRFINKVIPLILCVGLLFSSTVIYSSAKDVTINVYNWGEYIPDGTDGFIDLNKEFTKATGINVNYTTYDSNEEMYTKISNGGGDYDVIIPSDYMISKMINEDLLAPIDYSKVPNSKYIDKSFQNSEYDPGNVYSVPYLWGLVGILYNTKLVDPADNVESWDILWNEKYKGQILMFGNSRDAFGISLARLGYSQNSTDEQEWLEAADQLIKQRPLVQAYAMDQILDKMIAGEAALATYYAGDSIICHDENPDVSFAIPKDAVTNRYVDAMCVLKDSTKKDAAMQYINFVCNPEISYEVCQYAEYSTPNSETYKMLVEEGEVSDIQYPNEKVLANTEFFKCLPTKINKLENELWSEIRADTSGSIWQILAVVGGFLLIWGIVALYMRVIRRRKFK